MRSRPVRRISQALSGAISLPRLQSALSVCLSVLISVCISVCLLFCTGSDASERHSGLPLHEIISHLEKHSFFAGDTSFDLHDYFQNVTDIDDLRTFLKELDPYATFSTAGELTAARTLSARLPAGIGMEIFRDRSSVVHCVPYPGSPAEQAGIRYGDALEQIDDQPVARLSMDGIAERVRGKTGTSVRLQVRRRTDPKTLTVTVERRKTEDYPTVQLRREGKRSVLRIYRFGPKTAKELRACLAGLSGKNGQSGDGLRTEGLYIDLRGNTGGSLEAGIACAELFVRKGTVVARILTRNGIRRTAAPHDGPYAGLSVSLVQDSYTASAAELFIVALRSAGRARSFGSRSAGKACVQNLFSLPDGSMLKLTTEKLLYPTHEGDWEGTGLDPYEEQVRKRSDREEDEI